VAQQKSLFFAKKNLFLQGLSKKSPSMVACLLERQSIEAVPHLIDALSGLSLRQG
jgi:hypothetical protein